MEVFVSVDDGPLAEWLLLVVSLRVSEALRRVANQVNVVVASRAHLNQVQVGQRKRALDEVVDLLKQLATREGLQLVDREVVVVVEPVHHEEARVGEAGLCLVPFDADQNLHQRLLVLLHVHHDGSYPEGLRDFHYILGCVHRLHFIAAKEVNELRLLVFNRCLYFFSTINGVEDLSPVESWLFSGLRFGLLRSFFGLLGETRSPIVEARNEKS